jgi:predicted nucleotidyltransferase
MNTEWKNYNKSVLEGTVGTESRTMPTDDPFEILNSERFLKGFSIIYNSFLNGYLSSPDSFVKGFGIGGSWLRGTVGVNSDFDIVALQSSADSSVLLPDISEDLYHLNTFPSDLKTWKTFLSVASINPLQHKASLTAIVFLLNSMSFGSEFQRFQRSVVDLIEKMPEQKREKLWDAIASQMKDAMSGRLHWFGENMKYSTLVNKMTLEEYKRVMNARQAFANEFCKTHGFVFE